jgi:cysteine desulfurase
MPTYLDCNATTPVEPEVLQAMMQYLQEDYGNAGSRTHEFGARAKKAVQTARMAIAGVVACSPEEVVFTSGATESNNLAIIGLGAHAERTGKKHLITTAIEHKAVLEPMDHLERQGFEVTRLPVGAGGLVDPADLKSALRAETVLVSLMHVNNETGIIQPLDEVGTLLQPHDAFLHVDAAQGFGKDIPTLRNPRIDLISISSHKIYGPKGIGALVTRRRGFAQPPLQPIMFGGGQERGLRPGTLPVPLIVGLGVAAALALRDHGKRNKRNLVIREKAIAELGDLGAVVNGDARHCIASTINVSLPGLNSEAAMVALKDVISISNGSACTSNSYQPSHVLEAMGLSRENIDSALRLSWCHMTEDVDWQEVSAALRRLM